VSLVDESEALHQRVRAFARNEGVDSFEQLSLEIAHFQARWSPGYARLVAEHGIASLPAVPTDAFRFARVAVHPPELDVVRFLTSGTTGSARGLHAMRTTATYRELSVRFGKQRLMPSGSAVVVALAPPPTSCPESSLGFMMQAFSEELDADSPQGHWLLGDVAGLCNAASIAHERKQPLLVLATSFALVHLLDSLGDAVISAPERSVVMQTGGFKGKSREIDPAELRVRVARAFGIAADQVIGEYGMTELSSQLYESAPGIYVAPHWLRVTPVDPVSLQPVPEGVARFVDLGNVDSAVAIVTQDLIRRVDGGIELIGRRRGAPLRGCSLATEALLT
jgi:hypothetical protein